MDSLDFEKVVKLLGLRVDELAPCDIYVNYFLQYLANIEAKIYDLKNKVEYLERVCAKRDK
ncbi:hypothetical protein [Pyrobaculum calidifontis]|uniref:hypothetical protein n=1 Tax=Pyrobaculum calidifontis TaxID=181486 RepID=UPI000324C865|nr:hypothetical protein [Pyrobaculum calidifontis]